MKYSNILPIPIQLIRKYETKSSWLAHDSELHGVDHMARVFILQELICDKLETQGIEVDREVVRWASMAHDVGRLDDGMDLEHGVRSAKWIKDHLYDQLSPKVLDMVTYIVHWLVPPDAEAPGLQS
jgi:HD superfamily phosphodiesterase